MPAAGDVPDPLARSRRSWIRAVNATDLDAYADLVTDDVVWLPPGREAVEGRAAFRDWLEPFFADHRYDFSVPDAEVRVAGGRAVEEGSFLARITAAGGGEAREHAGRFVAFWREDADGSWRIERYADTTPAVAGRDAEDGDGTGRRGATAGDARAQIRRLHETDMDAARRGDVDALSALWTDDGVMLPPGEPPVRGRPAIRGWIRASVAASSGLEIVRYDQEFEEIRVAGGEAWEWGHYVGAYRTPSGDVVASSGRLMRVLRRRPGGAWRVARAMWQEAPVGSDAGR